MVRRNLNVLTTQLPQLDVTTENIILDDDELFAYLPLEDSILELLKKFAEVSDDDKKEKLKLFRVMMSLMVLVSAQIKFCAVFDSLIDCAQALMRMSLIHNVAP